jgi:hypothetical protein
MPSMRPRSARGPTGRRPRGLRRPRLQDRRYASASKAAPIGYDCSRRPDFAKKLASPVRGSAGTAICYPHNAVNSAAAANIELGVGRSARRRRDRESRTSDEVTIGAAGAADDFPTACAIAIRLPSSASKAAVLIRFRIIGSPVADIHHANWRGRATVRFQFLGKTVAVVGERRQK